MKKLFDIKYLPYLAALFQALQFAHAGSVYFGPFGWIIGGVGGTITNLAIASASSRISDIARSRKPLAYALGLILLLISPLAIAPAAYISASVIEWDRVRFLVAVVWALLPDLSIALTGAIVGRTLISHDATAQQTGSRTKQTAKTKSRRGAMTEQIECRWQCGRSGTRAAMNAHSRFCGKNPARQFEQAAKANNKEKPA